MEIDPAVPHGSTNSRRSAAERSERRAPAAPEQRGPGVELLRRLQAGHAFNPSPRHDQLYAVHVPFDELTGSHGCEAALERALRQGRRVALVGASGTGKSSVTEHVLGPLTEGLAPLRVPVTMERSAVATDPIEFARHLVTLVGRWVDVGLPQRSRDAAGLAPARRGASSHKVSVAPAWMLAKVELAYELSQAASQEAPTSTQVVEQAQGLLDLIRGDELTPVVVLDDTDRWLSTSWQPDNPGVRAAFFGRVVRVLAEELDVSAVVAVHPTYLTDVDYQASAGFLDTTLHVPQVPDAAAVGRILHRRTAEDLGVERDDLFTAPALAVLFEHYRHAPNIRRRLLLIANAALTLAVDAGADRIDREHCIAAITQENLTD